jgi:hypothetical protein
MQHTHGYELTQPQTNYFETEHEGEIPDDEPEIHHGDDNAFETKGLVMNDFERDNVAFFNGARDEHTRFTFDYT